jgi:hypothetical protein
VGKVNIEKDPTSIFKKFEQFEINHGLHRANKLGEINTWLAHRMIIYDALMKNMGVFETPHENSLRKNISFYFRVLKYLIKSPFHSPKCRTIIVPHKRKTLLNNKWVDLNSEYFIQTLGQNDLVVWDLSHNGGHKIKGDNIYYLDLVSIISRVSALFPVRKKFSELEDKFNEHFNSSVPLSNLLSSLDRQFRVKLYLFKKILKRVNPDKVYIVVAYGHTTLIKAAKDLGIEVIELQHGVINETHPGYHFSNPDVDTDYYPDKILVWHEMWKFNAEYPIDTKHIQINEHNHLNKIRNSISNTHVATLIISQGSIGELISEYIYKNSSQFYNTKVYYKLHPGEFEKSKSYTYLNLLKESDIDLQIIRSEYTVYELFSLVNKVIGVYSTVLYEAKFCGKEVYVLPITGYQIVKKAVEAKYFEQYDD